MPRAIVSNLAVAVLMALASKGHAAADFTDTAQVISSTPIVERIREPHESRLTPF